MKHTYYTGRYLIALLAIVVSFIVPWPMLALHAVTDVPGGDTEIEEFRIPVQFTENIGQWDKRVLYGALKGRDAAFLLRDRLMLRGALPAGSDGIKLDGLERSRSDGWVTIRFLGASKRIAVSSGDVNGCLSNFYLGNIEENWRSGAGNHASVRYENVWKGIDVEYTGEGNRLRQRFILAPGSRPGNIRLSLDPVPSVLPPSNLIELGTVSGSNYSARLVQRGGVITIAGLPDVIDDGIILETEFCTLFGGSGLDELNGHDVDGDGNMYVYGSTTSADLPVARAAQAIKGGQTDMFVARFNCDGRTLGFCTYLGGSDKDTCFPYRDPKYEGKLGRGAFNSDLGQDYYYASYKNNLLKYCNSNGEVYISGSTCSRDFPIAGNPLQAERGPDYDGFIAVLGRNGELLRSTYFGGPASICIKGMEVDDRGDVYVAGHAVGDSLWFVGGNTVQPSLHYDGTEDRYSEMAFCAKANADLKHVQWGTYLFTLTDSIKFPFRNFSFITDLVVDRQRNPIILGSSYNTQGSPDQPRFIPLVNPIVTGGSSHDIFITKLNSDATGYVHSTYFGGNDNGYTWVAEAICDDDDNLLITGLTTSYDFPLLNAFQGKCFYGHCVYLVKLSPTGRLLISCKYGNGHPYCIDFDPCGNTVINGHVGGTFNGDDLIPFIRPVDSVSTGDDCFLAVVSSAGDVLKRSTYLQYPDNSRTDVSRMKIGETGYVNIAEWTGCNRDEFTFNAYQTARKGERDIRLTRIRFPTCEVVSCSAQCSDTIRVASRRRYSSPGSFTLDASVSNISPSVLMTNPRLELQLPDWFYLDPPDQPLSVAISPSPLMPGYPVRHSWRLRFDSTKGIPGTTSINLVTRYTTPKTRCPEGIERCSVNVPVVVYDEPEPKLSCSITGPDSLKASLNQRSYEGNPFALRYTLRNIDEGKVTIAKVKLSSPSGMGVMIVPSPGSTLPGAVLEPGDEHRLSWTVTAESRLLGRTIPVTVTAYDPWGIAVSECEHEIAIPALHTLDCRLDGPPVIRYDSASGRGEPERIVYALTLHNPLDTLQGGIDAELLLPSSGSLLPLDSLFRRTLSIPARDSMVIEWECALGKPVQYGTARVTARYLSDAHPSWRDCALESRIEPVASLSCSLEAPDSLLSMEGTEPYFPNPFAVRGSFINTGIFPVPVAGYELRFDPPWLFETVGSRYQSGTSINPGDSGAAIWSISARAIYVNGVTATISVAALDSSGASLSRCEKSIVLPPIHPTLACALTSPDTISYDLESGAWSPDPFAAELELTNLLDTAQQRVEARPDFSLSPHIGIATGEALNKEIDSIPARGTARISWLLEVKGKVDSPVSERIKVLYRPAGDTSWYYCGYDILLDGKERLFRLACSAVGHDSVWADPGYEEIIPKPMQVSYTITNTGNVTINGCSAAIVLTDPFELYTGTDSVRQYGSICPGSSETRSWFLSVAEDRMAPGERLIRWERSCPDLGAEPVCEHRIKLVIGSPSGLVLTPRRLRFEAERNGALPASQQLELRPGGGLVMPWTLQSSTSWLDALPASGDRRTIIDVRPNTTAMPEGLYFAALDIQSAYPSSPPLVDVEYEIRKTTGITPEARPSGLHLEQNYPNPARTISTIRYHLPSAANATLALYDIYGRLVATLAEGAHPAGRHTATLDASGLAAGVYVCALSSSGRTVYKLMAVRR